LLTLLHMKPLSGLFKPIPFLIRYPVYYEKYYPEENYTLQLRPFSIMEDISVVYNWINKPRLLSSGHVSTYQRSMLKYYKTILDSSDSQTFMILQNSKAVCQFDLFPSSTDAVHSRISNGIYDVTVRYLADFRIPPTLFSNSLNICLDYLFSFSEDPEAFISMPPSGILNGNVFTSVGCKYVNGFFHDQEIVKVYSCKREGLIGF
jgi:hypothetical protein